MSYWLIYIDAWVGYVDGDSPDIEFKEVLNLTRTVRVFALLPIYMFMEDVRRAIGNKITKEAVL